MSDTRFVDILVDKGTILRENLNKAKQEADSRGVPLEDLLIEIGIPELEILKAKGEATGIPIKAMSGKRAPFDVLKSIPEESARHYQIVPLAIADGVLEVGMLNPQDIAAREALNFIASKLNMPFKIFLISKTDFNVLMEGYKSLGGEVTKVLGELETVIEEAGKNIPDKDKIKIEGFKEETPITKIVAVLLKHAVEGRASDIHIEPTRNNLRVRFRVDGILHTSLILPLKVHEAVVSRIKILTDMQLDEKRKPQDGRFSAKIDNNQVDFRVSTFPTYLGEKVAIRILDTEKGVYTLEDLGMSGRNLQATKNSLKKPYGLILLTGPTGSGKTTTLYAMLQMLNKEGANIVSLEDPIEYHIEGINQSQVLPEIGYSFANGLRSILRQDPDIIMVGEIRDKETAQLAIHAALTGHLVFSTLHTNTAVGVVPRLVDMGVDPFLIAPTLIMAIGQRLVRILCEESRQELAVEGVLKTALDKEMANIPEKIKNSIKMPANIYQAKPSNKCPKGTRGRIGVYEVLEMTPELKEIILTKSTGASIMEEARNQGLITMREDGVLKVLEGKVGLEELTDVI